MAKLSNSSSRLPAMRSMTMAGIAALLMLAPLPVMAETSSWSARTSAGKSTPVRPDKQSQPKSKPGPKSKVEPSTRATAAGSGARPSGRAPQHVKERDTQRLRKSKDPTSASRSLATSMATAIAAGGDDPAYYAFDRAEYLTALALAQKAAEKNEPAAHTLIGRLYAEGLGVPMNLPLAAKWYQRAAELGDAEAAFQLGIMFATGKGIKKNYDAAAQLFEKAAGTGHPYANYNLGLLFISGRGKPENAYRAAQHMTYAAEKGIPAAQYDLATLFLTGHGVPHDAYMASRWLKRAAELGMPEALFEYAVLLFQGRGLNEDRPRAADFLRAAARKGVPGAQNRLAHLLSKGEPGKRNLREAAKWQLLARSAGLADETLDKMVDRLPAADRLAAEQLAQDWRDHAIVGAMLR